MRCVFGLFLFGLGISALLGQGYVGIKPPKLDKLNFGALSDIPVLGKIVFVPMNTCLLLHTWLF